MDAHLIPLDRVRAVVRALIFASVLSLVLLVVRAIFIQHLELKFYIWNLFLAWLPLLFAMRVYRLATARPIRGWTLLVSAVLWFLFFPNAPYLVTDFLHLRFRPYLLPPWFDIVLMMSFAWIGLLLGYLSLMLMQETVRLRRGAVWGWAFAVLMLALGSFGIYLGRIARWNSWDALIRPHILAEDVLVRTDVKAHPEMLAFFLTFLCFSLLSYATFYALAHLHRHTPHSPLPGGDAPPAQPEVL